MKIILRRKWNAPPTRLAILSERLRAALDRYKAKKSPERREGEAKQGRWADPKPPKEK